MPDRFYFIKFFDPYIKREFEVIRTETANNSMLFPRRLASTDNASPSECQGEPHESLRIPSDGKRNGIRPDGQLSLMLRLH